MPFSMSVWWQLLRQGWVFSSFTFHHPDFPICPASLTSDNYYALWTTSLIWMFISPGCIKVKKRHTLSCYGAICAARKGERTQQRLSRFDKVSERSTVPPHSPAGAAMAWWQKERERGERREQPERTLRGLDGIRRGCAESQEQCGLLRGQT